MKKFWAIAACIAVVGSTADFAFSETVSITNKATADGSSSTLSNIKNSLIGGYDNYTWLNGDSNSVTAYLNSGTLTVSNYSSSIVNGILNAANGTLNISSGTLTINSDSSIASAVYTTVSSGSVLEITGGRVNLNSADTLSGQIAMSSGTLNLNDVSKSDSFTQTGGTTNISGTFNLNDASDNISGSVINIQPSGTLTVSSGTVESDNTVTISQNGSLNVSGGNASLSSSDNWYGNVNVSNGNLNLDNVSKSSSAAYSQTGGTVTITGDNFDLNNSSDNISGGTVNIGEGDTDGYLTVSKGTIGTNANVNITDNGILDITGGTVNLDNATDSYRGIVGVSNGVLNINGIEKSSTAVFAQDGGTTNITGSGFALNNSLDEVSGGTLNIGTSSTSGTLGVQGGVVNTETTVNIAANGEIKLSSGTVTLDSDDTWSGIIDMNGGTLNIDNAQKTGEIIQTNGTVNVTGKKFDLNNTNDLVDGGILNIGDGTTSAELNVSQGTITTDSTVNINSKGTIDISGGNVTLDSDDTWTGTVNMNGGNLALVGINKTGTLTQTNGSTTVTGRNFDLNNENDYISGGSLTVGNGLSSSNLNVSQGAISKDTAVNITNNATVNVNGGNVELGNSTTWNGNVNVSSGNLTIDSAAKNDNGSFVQSGGTTTVIGTGFDMNNSADIVSGGTLNIGNRTTATDLTVSNGIIESDATVNINRNGTLNISGGEVELGDNDSWNGNVNISDGSLALVGINKNSSGKYTQSGGTVTISQTAFNMNNTGDNISGGTVNIGDGSSTSNLNVSNGNIESNANINLNTNSNINISGGNVALDNSDTWNGNVNVSNGNLTLNNLTNKNGILTQTNGTTTVTGTGFDLNNASDNISGGKLTVGDGTAISEMNVSQGTIGANTTVNINANAALNITGGTANLHNSTKNQDGVLTQSAGTTTISGTGFDLNNAADNISGGTINLGNGSTASNISISKGTIQSSAITNINTNSTLNISGGNVNLDNTDTWNGNINISDGSLNAAEIGKNSAAHLVQTGGTTNITGTSFDLNNSADNISGGTFNVGTDSETSTMTVSKGTIAQGASTNIAAGSSVNITGGNVTLDGETDGFNGNVNLSGGNLALVGMNKNSSAVLTQTGGTTTVTGTGSVLNNESDNISAGNLIIGTNSTAGELNIEKGTIASNAAVTINETGTLNIKGGTATLDSSDKWNGSVNVTDGTLNLNSHNKTTSSTAKFNQSGGTTNIDNSKLTLNTSDSKISGGTVNITSTGELDVNNSSENSSELNSTGGKFSIRKGSKYRVTNGTVDTASTVTVEDDAEIEINGDSTNVTLDGNNDKVSGHIKLANGTLNLSDGISKTTTTTGTYNQTGGSANISGASSLTLNDENSTISDGEVNVSNNSSLIVNNGKKHSSRINVTGSSFGLKGKSTYTTKGGTIDADSDVTIESASKLEIDADDANVTLDGNNDKWDGSVQLAKGNLYISDDLTKVTDANGNYIQTGGSMTMSKSSLTLNDENSTISGGNVNLTDNSKLTVTQNSGAAITGGNIVIDDTSVLNYLAQKGLIQIAEGNQINIDTSGLINMANNVRTNSVINNLTVNNGNYGDGQANFAVDIYARSNGNASSDTITANSIKVATKDSAGTIHISDFNLNGDIFGYDAPIDKNIRLGKIFKSDDIDSEINFTSTDKEIFTPIGYYKLNPSSANDGNYTLDLARFNPQVFRGQVATAASYMNQLVINDTLFNRAQIRRYGASYDQMFKNKTALLDGTASFERKLKEGQLWTEMFGNFETLKMNNSLDKVRNNSWGFIIGADFGLKELKNGWTYMPTAYIAYNGGHQTFNKVGIYENGGQLGFMNSWMKQNFMETAMVYAGVYGTDMNIAGQSEDAFNYFLGVASKSAYDWNLGSHFKVQPSLTLAYNMFGQQNWHSDYGQMGMSSGFLNGFNIAPGVNFIWQQETWNVYATIAYAWNFFAGIDGRAGNVDLPGVKMAHGYLQYGFGMTKSISDRLNMYAQATIRNVGRTGIICQGGINWRL